MDRDGKKTRPAPPPRRGPAPNGAKKTRPDGLAGRGEAAPPRLVFKK